jgi:hypothetical protein
MIVHFGKIEIECQATGTTQRISTTREVDIEGPNPLISTLANPRAYQISIERQLILILSRGHCRKTRPPALRSLGLLSKHHEQFV